MLIFYRTAIAAVVSVGLILHASSAFSTLVVDAAKEIQAQSMSTRATVENQTFNVDIDHFMTAPCVLLQRMMTFSMEERLENWVCELNPVDRMEHNTRFMLDLIGVSDTFLKTVGAKSGMTTLFSPFALIQENQLVFDKNHAPTIGERLTPTHRQLTVKTTGERIVVFVRILAPDSSTTPSEYEISNSAFGTFGEVESLRTGYLRCSHNQLLLNPTQHPLANNGVINVTISMAVTGTWAMDVYQAAHAALATKLNVQYDDLFLLFDNLVFCIPPGVNGFFAFAFMGIPVVVANSLACLFNPGMMHEIGHNLQLHHSGQLMNEYDDTTCQMGVSAYWPMCFNGAKSYQLGWYSPRTKTIDLVTSALLSPMSFTLIGTSDYQNPNNDPHSLVILKLEMGALNYYIAFNRKIGINARVNEYGDQVVITTRKIDGNSNLVQHLSSTNSMLLTAISIGTSVYDVKIDVNSINLNTDPGIAIVTVSQILSTVAMTDSAVFGGSGESDYYSAICPTGTKVKSINGMGDGYVGQLIIFCDNNSLLGPIGIGGGARVIGKDCSSGFSGITVTYGIYVGMIEPVCGSETLPAIGSGQGDGSGQSTNFTCPGTQKVVGIRGKAGVAVDSISFLCADFSEVVSEMYGGTGGQYYFSQQCPPGMKIINFSGRGDNGILQVVAQCDDGSNLGPVGEGTGGFSAATTICTGGYTGASITYGEYITKLSLKCSSGTGAIIDSYGSGQTKSFQCPNNLTIVGIRGKASLNVNSLSFVCGSSTAVPTAAPSLFSGRTTKPTARPATKKPSARPMKKPSTKPSLRPTKKPTARPTNLPSGNPLAKATARPTSTIISLSARPTKRPSRRPAKPTSNPTRTPSRKPTRKPTRKPSRKPSRTPTTKPSRRPSRKLTKKPTRKPTSKPSRSPSRKPTKKPTRKPSRSPAKHLSQRPTKRPRRPSRKPTKKPTRKPTSKPPRSPSRKPSRKPTKKPTRKPSRSPTKHVSRRPSMTPSFKPSNQRHSTITDSNIQLAAYQWVRNKTIALATYGEIRFWDTSRVTNMYGVFGMFNPYAWSVDDKWWASAFNDDISQWDTGKVTNMARTFEWAISFNGDLSQWDTSQVTELYFTFCLAVSFNADLSRWNTSQVNNMEYTFAYVSSFNSDLSLWDTNRVRNMRSMFFNASSFNIDLSPWNTSQLEYMDSMFFNAYSFNQVLCWDTVNVIDMDKMFEGSGGSFSTVKYPGCLTVS